MICDVCANFHSDGFVCMVIDSVGNSAASVIDSCSWLDFGVFTVLLFQYITYFTVHSFQLVLIFCWWRYMFVCTVRLDICFRIWILQLFLIFFRNIFFVCGLLSPHFLGGKYTSPCVL